MKLIRTLMHLGAGLVIAASWSGAAHADGDTGVSAKVVHVSDLNLGSSQDVAELFRRINLAAQAVCPDPDSESGIRANQARYCLKQAVQHAVRRVNSPALTALFLQEQTRPGLPLLARSAP